MPDETTGARPQTAPGATDAAAGGGGKRPILFLAAGLVVIAAGAGYGLSRLTAGGADALAPASAQAAGAAAASAPADDADASLQYYDFEAITVNLDEPRLARYVTVTLTLAIPAAQYEEAMVDVEAQLPVLKDWLNVYFSSCSLEDVRGAVNMNRIRREILDGFNGQLWPDRAPRIRHVFFKKFTVS